MTTLVTGATGFIGSHLVELLLKRKMTVRVLLRKTSSTAWLKGLPVEFMYGDLFDRDALAAAVRNVDYVYHSAGLTKAKTEKEYFHANTTGTTNLLEAALKEAPRIKRFVLVSSQTACGPSPTKSPVTELAPPHPITSYGRSKLAAERECTRLGGSIPVTIVRPPAVFGPRDKDVFEFFNTINKGLQPIVGFGEKYVSLIHVMDLVRGIVLAGESNHAGGQTYFISSREVYDWSTVGEITQKILEKRVIRVRIPEFGVYTIAAFAEFFSLFSRKPALINFEKARDMVQDYWTCDSSKAKHDFGFEQEISLEAGIGETIGWYKEKGWLK
jgi:nucleoside-diphosphate-sugar epimerase